MTSTTKSNVFTTSDYQSLFLLCSYHLGKKMQRHFEKVPRLVKHRLPPVDKRSSQWNELASHLVFQATTSFEVKRRANMEDKKRRRKNRDSSEINTGQIMTCSRCGKTCLTWIGFISHQRPAPDEDVLLPVSSFAKHSHDDHEYYYDNLFFF